MVPNEQRTLVLNVNRTIHNRWQVVSDPVEDSAPLFDTPQEACSWAIARAKLQRGRVLFENVPVTIKNEKDIYPRPPQQKPCTGFYSNRW